MPEVQHKSGGYLARNSAQVFHVQGVGTLSIAKGALRWLSQRDGKQVEVKWDKVDEMFEIAEIIRRNRTFKKSTSSRESIQAKDKITSADTLPGLSAEPTGPGDDNGEDFHVETGQEAAQ